MRSPHSAVIYTENPLYTGTPYDNIRYNNNFNVTKPSLSVEVTDNEKLCENFALKLQATFVLDICLNCLCEAIASERQFKQISKTYFL